MSFQPMNEMNEKEKVEYRAYRHLRGLRTEIYKFLLSVGVPVEHVVATAEEALKPLVAVVVAEGDWKKV